MYVPVAPVAQRYLVTLWHVGTWVRSRQTVFFSLKKNSKNKIKMPYGWRTITSLVHKVRLHGRLGKGMAESFSREKLRHAPQKEGGWEILCDLAPVWPRLVRPTNLMSRMSGKKTQNTHVCCCGCCCLHINRSGLNHTRGCQSGTWSQWGTKVNGSHHGDNPLLGPTGIQIATKSYATLQAMAPTNNKTVHQTSFTP